MSRRRLEFLVVGDPVEHSLSPRIQQAALDWTGIDGRYGRRRVDTAGMAGVVEEIRDGRLHGVNVTMPHKELAARLADTLTPEAARTGAVNTLSAVDGEVEGHITDIDGIRWAWEQVGWPPDEPAVIVGSGGAASAALVAFAGRRLWITARRPHRAEALVRRVGVAAEVIPWGAGVPGVLVNATPIGMTGSDHLPPALLEAATGVFDMVYAAETAAVRHARERGIRNCGGGLMLVGQAAAAFARWTGADPPHGVMLEALNNT